MNIPHLLEEDIIKVAHLLLRPRRGQKVYLPMHWRKNELHGNAKLLNETALNNPWVIKNDTTNHNTGEVIYELEQTDVVNNLGIAYTLKESGVTKKDLIAGEIERVVKAQATNFLDEKPKAYSKLRCETVEKCQKIIEELVPKAKMAEAISNYLKTEHPVIHRKMYNGLGRMRFRIKKSKRTKRKSRKRRSVKRKASRKPKKKTVKELRADCKARGLVYDPKTKKCRVSKRRSAKRKSRKVKRKVSRKRRSAKRKSRKVKRKVSRKRRSAKRKSRKRKSRKSSRKKVIGGKMRTIHKSKNPIPYDEDWAKGFVTHIGPGGGGGVNNYTGTKKVPTRRILDARKKLIDKIYFLHDQLVALDSSLVKDMFAVEILNPTEWRDPPQYMDRDDLKHYVKIMTVDVKSEKQKLKNSHKFSTGNKIPASKPRKIIDCWDRFAPHGGNIPFKNIRDHQTCLERVRTFKQNTMFGGFPTETSHVQGGPPGKRSDR